jgi:hypothetical protein
MLSARSRKTGTGFPSDRALSRYLRMILSETGFQIAEQGPATGTTCQGDRRIGAIGSSVSKTNSGTRISAAQSS